VLRTVTLWAIAAAALFVHSACGSKPEPAPPETPTPARDPSPAYPISPAGGTPATGPGERYNHCERIWCLVHGENFALPHFLADHVGYVLHSQSRGDVYVPRRRTTGPELSDASNSALMLCGSHVHPWLFTKSRGGPVRHTGFNRALGYSKAHFASYGTRLDPCCVNGLGSGFVHSAAGKQFRFHETSDLRKNPSIGWQEPFAARVPAAR